MSSLQKFRDPKLFPIYTLIVLTLAAYVNGISGPFLWDDLETVINNPIIREWKNIGTLFTTSIFGQVSGANEFFRPMVSLSLLINFKIGGLNPFWFHITNMLLHIGSTILIFLLLQQLHYSKKIALLAGAIFAIHPIGTEVVTYISGRSDALASVFILLSIFAFTKINEQKRWIMLTIISFLAALLSKESAIIVPFILLGILWTWPKQKNNNKTKIAFSMLAVSILYSIIRFIALNGAISGSLSWISEASVFQRIISIPYIIVTYLRIFLFPYPLHMEYHFVVESLADISFWIGLIFLIGLIVLLLKKHVKNRKTVFWIFWFIIGIAPVLHLPVAQTSTVREHWIYLPAIGLSMLILTAPIWKKYSEKKLFAISAIVICIMGIITIDRNRDWLDAFRLYTHDVRLEPKSFVLWNNLGTEYYKLGTMEMAGQAFSNAILQSPNQKYSVAFNNLGVVTQNTGDLEQAEKLFLQSIALNNYELAYGNLAKLYLEQDKIEDAKKIITQGMNIHIYSFRLRNISDEINNKLQNE